MAYPATFSAQAEPEPEPEPEPAPVAELEDEEETRGNDECKLTPSERASHRFMTAVRIVEDKTYVEDADREGVFYVHTTLKQGWHVPFIPILNASREASAHLAHFEFFHEQTRRLEMTWTVFNNANEINDEQKVKTRVRLDIKSTIGKDQLISHQSDQFKKMVVAMHERFIQVPCVVDDFPRVTTVESLVRNIQISFGHFLRIEFTEIEEICNIGGDCVVSVDVYPDASLVFVLDPSQVKKTTTTKRKTKRRLDARAVDEDEDDVKRSVLRRRV